jgi:acyl-CoA thioesterase II
MRAARRRRTGERVAGVGINPIENVLRVLDLRDDGARTSEDIFTGDSHPMPHGRVFGGQVLAQSLVAATRTLPADRVPHSMHGYFLRPGDAREGITFAVDRIHDGRSFSTRRTQAFQRGVPIFSMIASFQVEDAGLDHQLPMPAGIADPDDLPVYLPPARSADELAAFPLDLRPFADPVRGVQGVWVRTRSLLPDDPDIQRAALAYLSDWSIQDAVLRPHDVSWTLPGLKVASLDHAMWFHRPARADDWLFYAQESPSARSGRGLATGRMYTRDGVLVASVAQEIMVRVPQDVERDDDR